MYEAGLLYRLFTSIVSNPDNLWQNRFFKIGTCLGQDWKREFSKRKIEGLPKEKIDCFPWGELLRVAVSRIDRDQRLSDLVWQFSEGSFDRRVATHLTPDIRAVYGFEYSSRRTFQKAKKMGLKIAYEMPAPEPIFVHELLQEERGRFPELETPYTRHVARREQMWIDHRKVEWDCADIVIAASHFTKNSFQKAGWDVSKTRVVPLGAPACIPEPNACSGGTQNKGPLKLVWAGTFGVRKGAHYVLEAWRSFRLGKLAHLEVFGSPALPSRLMSNLPEGITFHGAILREKLLEKFMTHDALLFPTLCDGFGMVVTEAWSRGLPVITTERAGAAEKLVHLNNGLLIRPADISSIASAVEWCASNREHLKGMRLHALQAASSWSWKDYRQALLENIVTLIK